jgi:hypothetical protein
MAALMGSLHGNHRSLRIELSIAPTDYHRIWYKKWAISPFFAGFDLPRRDLRD